MTKPTWETCSECPGVQVEGFGKCFAHLDPEQLEQFLGRLGPDGTIDARGTSLTEDLLGKLTRAASSLGILDLSRAELETVENLGPLAVNRLILDGARFSRRVRIEVVAALVSCVKTRFDGGVTLQVRYAAINASNAIFGAISSISGAAEGYQAVVAYEWLSTWVGKKDKVGRW